MFVFGKKLEFFEKFGPVRVNSAPALHDLLTLGLRPGQFDFLDLLDCLEACLQGVFHDGEGAARHVVRRVLLGESWRDDWHKV